jgi:hypothetical protein
MHALKELPGSTYNKKKKMNTGRIIKRRIEKNFTMISNDLINSKELSLEEKGLLIYILSLPDDWHLYKNSLASRTGEKPGTIDRIFKSLQEKGYIVSTQVKNGTGQFKGWDHIVFESLDLKFTIDKEFLEMLSLDEETPSLTNACLGKQ